ncbi:MAG: DNA mismatch repair endonuclease MutL [Deltaproteobacteria bacterium]|nr:DNA mismatch repair endonuclease MutL [Deltaproteobacteria bacterium]
MSGKIVRLPEDLTNKIAAGEVVERPASIVKELLENALDAGATDVTIELTNGGCGAIKIVDNGEGMDHADVPRAFERYATSKIYEFGDLYKVKSFGFRGEALPSIASVSRVELISKRPDALTGIKVIVENGKILDLTETGCPPGTSVRVDHIFDAVPVRKKFLKKEITEQGNCMDVITRTALAHPEVRIKVLTRGKMLMNIPPTKDLSERISLVLGTDFTDHGLSVSGSKEGIGIEGFVSRADFTRSSAKHLFFFVNKRFIRDYLINHAVITVYGRLIEARRYPSAVLFIDIPPDAVDVNVHPNKMEVRFENPRSIYDAVYRILTDALAETTPVLNRSSVGVSNFHPGKTGPWHYHARIEEALKRYTVKSGTGKLFFDQRDFDRRNRTNEEAQQQSLFAPDQTGDMDVFGSERITFSDLDYIGQAGSVYLLFQSAAALVIVDQHAAHERVLFDQLKEDADKPEQKSPGQRLLMPEILSLTPKDYAFIMRERQTFVQAGIEIEPFGTSEVAVKTVPARLAHIAPKDLMMDMLEEFSETERVAEPVQRQDKIFAVMACKGAVKANQRLSTDEVTALCQALDATPFSATCPHGRPVYIVYHFTDLEKMFKRR